jgi:hypothetical protein
VNQGPSTTAVAIDVNPSIFGQVVSMTASVHAAPPAAGKPTGNVTFLDGSATLGMASVDTSGRATFSTSALSQGNHSIRAAYGGDGNFTGSTSRVYGEPVNRAATTVTISSSSASSVMGQSVSLTATIGPVAPGSGIPTGTVTFFDGSVAISSNLNVKGAGQAILLTTNLSVGTHTITASYSGDKNFQSSSGNDSAQPQVVAQDGTHSTVTLPKNTAVFGEVVTLTASVSANFPGSGAPNGTVTFIDFGQVMATATLSGGKATANVGALAIGNHSIKASYAGDSSFVGSLSIAYGETVLKGSTATALHSAPNPSSFGNAVTLTAAVGVVTPASGVPGGMVTFKDGTTILGSHSVDSKGQATFSTATLSVGSHTISAIYGGDNHFTGSSDPALNQMVTTGLASVGPTSALAPNQYSTPVNATAPISSSTLQAITSPPASVVPETLMATTPSAADHFFASSSRTGETARSTKLGHIDDSDGPDWLGAI